jgi:aryl-alcohol dehydrogenase-like predicted oxidoreductase
MKKLTLGKSGVEVSQIIQGLWASGGGYFGDPQDQNSIEAIREALSVGIDTFDTAELYGNGHSEAILGEALKGIARDRYVLISKVWTTHYRREDMESSLDASMKRMNTDYLDVYFLHYPPDWGNPANPATMEEAVSNINEMKKKGKICSIGVSNFSLAQLKEAQAYAQIDVLQPCYSLLWRYIDRDVLPYARENNIGVITYSSLAQGILTGKLSKDKVPEGGRGRAALFQPGIYEQCLDVTEFIRPIAAKYDRTVAQVVINWMANTHGITAPIVGISRKVNVEENIKALDFELSKEDYDAIDARSKQFTDTMPEFELFFNTNIKQ